MTLSLGSDAYVLVPGEMQATFDGNEKVHEALNDHNGKAFM